MLPKFITKRKFIFVVVVLLLFSLLLAKPIQAFVTPDSTYQFQFEQATYKTPQEMNLQSFVLETLKATAGSVVTTLTGCTTCDEEQRDQYPGLLVMTGSLIANIYANPLASGVQYLADMGNRIGIVTPAYAQGQGTGFEAMKVILPIWKAFRDISYVFFVLIFIGVGFAIMFRVKISPQAVITIQFALPRIVMALILVTFSYAIAGFLIDLMIILCILLASVFREALISQIADIVPSAKPLLDQIVQLYIRLFGPYAATSVTITAYTMGTMLTTFLTVVLLTIVGMPIGALVGGVVGLFGGPATAAGGAAVGALAGPIFAIILLVIVFIILLRCLWTLFKAYLGVLLGIIFAPFQILAGVLPGSNAISGWFRNLIANIAVMPVMFTMFLLASFFSFVWIFQLIGFFLEGSGVTRDLIITALEALGVRNLNPFYELFFKTGTQGLTFFITPIIGLGILFMAPKAADMIQAFIQGKPFGYGAAIGEAIPGLAFGKKAAEEYIMKKEILGGFPLTQRVGERVGVLEPKAEEERPTRQ